MVMTRQWPVMRLGLKLIVHDTVWATTIAFHIRPVIVSNCQTRKAWRGTGLNLQVCGACRWAASRPLTPMSIHRAKRSLFALAKYNIVGPSWLSVALELGAKSSVRFSPGFRAVGVSPRRRLRDRGGKRTSDAGRPAGRSPPHSPKRGGKKSVQDLGVEHGIHNRISVVI